MKHIFGLNKSLNARRMEERRQEEEAEAAFQREEEEWEREDSRRFERERRRSRRDSSSNVSNNVIRRRSFVDVEKADKLVEQAMREEKNAPKRGLMLFQRALALYIPALKQGGLDSAAKSKVMTNTQHAMEHAEQLKLEILENRRGIVDGKLYFNGGMPAYAFLDNIACQVPILVDGKTYPSTEHYFQSQKFKGTPLEEKIRNTIDPVAAKQIGKTSPGLRSDWETVKIDFMLKAVAAKFDQHDALRLKLLDTSPYLIVEHAKDMYWGNGIYDEGRNVLGKILTTVRDGYLKKARSKKNIAIMTLHRAIDADRCLNHEEALVLYRSGIEDYFNAAKNLPTSERKVGYSLLEQCIQRLENIQHVQTQTDQDVPVVPASLVMFIPNASAPTLPVAQVISDSGSDKFT